MFSVVPEYGVAVQASLCLGGAFFTPFMRWVEGLSKVRASRNN